MTSSCTVYVCVSVLLILMGKTILMYMNWEGIVYNLCKLALFAV